GVSVAVFGSDEFSDWITSATEVDLHSVEGVVLGNFPARELAPRTIRARIPAPIIVLTETPSLEQTLTLFSAGADDVVRKPVHAREILARIATIRRRLSFSSPVRDLSPGLAVFFDGRD